MLKQRASTNVFFILEIDYVHVLISPIKDTQLNLFLYADLFERSKNCDNRNYDTASL